MMTHFQSIVLTGINPVVGPAPTQRPCSHGLTRLRFVKSLSAGTSQVQANAKTTPGYPESLDSWIKFQAVGACYSAY